eukprot:TRINITY_DN10083_c0_g1_i1.p2 TRINITY_DN10083_c0_g1~~TRINITY_DN10083_c0_g1_i1.p2  ORF type:complete len:201 (-),score=47.79 TRINITY_DN10083_c0_g1_i1:51-620(-)
MATHAAVSWNAAVPAGCASGAAALALPRWAPHWRDRDELVPPHPLDVLGATGRPSGSSAVAASTGFIYVQAIRASGEEIAWLRVRPAHHIGALRERLARLLFGEGSSCLRLAAHGRMLEDQDIVAGAGICSGSVLAVFSRAAQKAPCSIAEDTAQLYALEAAGFCWTVSDEELFVARHKVGAKKVLTVP